MTVGDLVTALHSRPDACILGDQYIFGIVIRVDDSHRQTVADVLFSTGIEKNIWENHLEVISETR